MIKTGVKNTHNNAFLFILNTNGVPESIVKILALKIKGTAYKKPTQLSPVQLKSHISKTKEIIFKNEKKKNNFSPGRP